MRYLIILLLIFSGPALSQQSNSYTFVVPWLAGGAVDYVARHLARELESSGVKVQVENRPGLNGVVGANYVAKQRGQNVLLVDQLTTYLNMHYNRDALTMDMMQDIQVVSHIAEQYGIISVHPSIPINSFREFVNRARARPGLFSFGHGGRGSPSYLSLMIMQKYGRLQLHDINYKSNTPALIALAAGEIDIISTNVTVALPLVRMKKVKPIATSWINNRDPLLEHLEPAAKYIPELTETQNMVLFAPATLAPEIWSDIRTRVNQIVRSPGFAQRMSDGGNQARSLSDADLAALVKQRLTLWATLIN